MPDSPTLLTTEADFYTTTVEIGRMQQPRLRAWQASSRWGPTFLAFVFYFLVIAAVQRLTGAVGASFGLYPDEPAHYVSSLLFRDYIASGFHANPVAFAVNYYTALPYFGVGYWPPAFYIISGIWLLLFGVQRASALALTTVVTALLAATVFHVLRRRIPSAMKAALWALLVLLVPQVIKSSSMFMLDLPVALFSLWTMLQAIEYCKAPHRTRHAVGYALFASLTFLTKYSGAFVFAFPFIGLLATRRWRLLRKKWFWGQLLLSGVLCAPWVLFTRRLMSVGLAAPPGGALVSLRHALLALRQGLGDLLGIELVLAALVALAILLWKRGWRLEIVMYAAAPLCLLASLLPAPVDADQRYFLPALAPVVLLAAYGLSEVAWRAKFVKTAIPLALCAAGIARCGMDFPQYPPDQLHSLVEFVNANPQWKYASILLPSGCEGPAVAEFAEYEQQRPSQVLLRPSKIVAQSGWWGIRRLRFSSAAQLRRELLNEPIDLVLLDLGKSCRHTAADPLIFATLQAFPGDWKPVSSLSLRSAGPNSAIWEIYQSRMQSNATENLYRERTLNRFRTWRALASP